MMQNTEKPNSGQIFVDTGDPLWYAEHVGAAGSRPCFYVCLTRILMNIQLWPFFLYHETEGIDPVVKRKCIQFCGLVFIDKFRFFHGQTYMIDIEPQSLSKIIYE